jgi:hypothetical protein
VVDPSFMPDQRRASWRRARDEAQSSMVTRVIAFVGACAGGATGGAGALVLTEPLFSPQSTTPLVIGACAGAVSFVAVFALLHLLASRVPAWLGAVLFGLMMAGASHLAHTSTWGTVLVGLGSSLLSLAVYLRWRHTWMRTELPPPDEDSHPSRS